MSRSVTVTVTEDDVWRVSRRMLGSQLYWWSLVAPIVAGGMVAVAGVWLDWPVALTVVGVVVTVVWVAFSVARIPRRMVLKHARSQPGMLGEHTFTILPEGLRETTDYNDTLNTWEAISSVERDESALYIYLAPMTAHIVPLRDFDFPQAAEHFEEELRSRLSPGNQG